MLQVKRRKLDTSAQPEKELDGKAYVMKCVVCVCVKLMMYRILGNLATVLIWRFGDSEASIAKVANKLDTKAGQIHVQRLALAL